MLAPDSERVNTKGLNPGKIHGSQTCSHKPQLGLSPENMQLGGWRMSGKPSHKVWNPAPEKSHRAEYFPAVKVDYITILIFITQGRSNNERFLSATNCWILCFWLRNSNSISLTEQYPNRIQITWGGGAEKERSLMEVSVFGNQNQFVLPGIFTNKAIRCFDQPNLT